MSQPPTCDDARRAAGRGAVSSRIGPWALGLLAAVLVFTVPACERQGRAGPGDTESSPREGGASKFVESKGESCNRDPDCSGYLRCLEGTCRVPPAVTGEQDAQTPVVEFRTKDDSETIARFYVELATNRAQRRRGLMFRPKMRPSWGMLFVYPDEKKRSFWMKNTYIPLDMVFLDSSGRVVHVVHRAEPRTTTPRSSERPARYVLELNGGTASDEGIVPGTLLTVENVPSRFAPAQ